MTRTKSWLLIGTILPALTLAQSGQAQEPPRGPIRVAQAPAPSDDQPDGRQRQRQPGQPPRGPGEGRPAPGAAPGAPPPAQRPAPGAPPAVQRPAPPSAPGAAPPGVPTAPRPPAEPRREPAMPRPVPPIATPESAPAQRPAPAPGQPPALRGAPGQSAPGAAPEQRRATPPTPPATAPQQRPQAAPAPVQPPVTAPPAARTPGAPAPATTPGIPPAARPTPAPGQPSAIPPAPAQRQPGAEPPMPRPVPPIIAPGAQQPGQQPGARTQPAPGQPPTVAPGQPPAVAPGRAPGAPVPPPAAQPGQTQMAPPAVGQPPAPGQQPLPPPDRQGRRGGIGLGGAAAIGLGAAAIGGIMATQGADRIDDVRSRREERREGDVTIIREPGRTIIRGDDDRYVIQRDETQRFRDLGYQGRTERGDGETRTVFERPDGTRVVTVTDESGRLIRRTRFDRDGREVVIIDNRRRDDGRPRFAEDVVVLPPPPLPLPRERYIVDAERADENLIYETITAPPIAAIPRRYTLDEVRYSPDLRARMRSVDIDTVNFDSGSWQVAQGQDQKLAIIAASIRKALERSPNEVFLVEGHTDAVGNDVDNLSLSDRRAQSVGEILTRDFQVPPENLTTQGYGEQYLKVQTQEASRENRRVTLRRITPLLAGQN